MTTGSAFTAFSVERFRLMISEGSRDWVVYLRKSMDMSEDSENWVIDAFVHSLAKSLQTSRNDLQITNILNILDEHANVLIDSTEALFGILASLQALIDHSSKRHASDSEGSSYHITDTIRSQALISYTNLLIQFPDISVNVRAQFVKALVDMSNRRSLKKKDYVNSQLRAVACECLSEIELMFPGEVSEALRLPAWFASANPTTPPPPLIDAIQDENFACFENYMKLLLSCCSSYHTISEKPLLKTLSLSLEAVEFSSSWFRHKIAVTLESLVLKSSADTSSIWNHAVILHHFSRLLSCSDVHQVHAFITISLPFVRDWSTSTDLPELLIDRIAAITTDPHVLSVPIRLLAIAWLNSLISNTALSEIVYSRRFSLAPKFSDSPPVTESKLNAIVHFASQKNRIPKQLLSLIPPDTSLPVTFRFVTKILLRFGHLDLPNLLGIPTFLTDMIRPTAAIAAVMPGLIRVVQITKSSPLVYTEFLAHLGQFVSQLIQPPSRTLQYFALLCFLAATPESDPQYVIASLSRFLTEGETPLESQWEAGMKLLEVLRLITMHHSVNIVPTLRILITAFHNVDIRDRAELFVKYESALRGPQRNEFMKKEKFDKVHPLDLSEESQSLSPLPHTETVTSLPLIRFSKDKSRRKNDLKIFDDCWAVFKNGKLKLPFILEFDPSDSGHIDKLFAVQIVFSSCEGFVPFLPVEIPYLERPSSQSQPEGFPHKYNLELQLQAEHPLPGEFSVSLTFTDIQGDSHSVDLSPFSIDLEDLFMPVPIPLRGSVFQEKWRDPFAKLLEIPRDTIERIVRDRLHHFVVSDDSVDTSCLPPLDPFDFELEAMLHTSSVSETPKNLNVIISLPPRFHLMLRFVMGSHTTVVWICTDFPDVLILLDNYFDTWTKDSVKRITDDIDRLISA